MNTDPIEAKVPAKTVMVVDDDPGILILAEEAIQDAQIRVVTFSSGEAALSEVAQIKPDIVLLDIMMPGIDGFETCREIKKIAGFENMPIIMLTGRGDVAAVERAYDAGALDFTSKPINWPILRHRVLYSLRAFEAFSTERKAARLSKTLDSSSNEIIEFDAQNLKINNFNSSAAKNLGYTAEEITELDFFDISSGTARNGIERQLLGMTHQQQLHVHLDLKRRDGSSYPVDGIVLYNTEEQPHVYIGIFQDITERKRTEQELHRLAYYDDLTGLPNRRMFKEHVNKALSTAQRTELACAVCILDLDGFKSVNDALGHSKGDLLLQQVSDRLAAEVRQQDAVARLIDETAEDCVELELARLGGDEFLVLLTNFGNATTPAKVADRILKSVSLPYNLNGQELNVTASIGIALYPEDGDSLDILMKHADNAMYTAKQSGKNSYAYYSIEKGMSSLARFALEADLHKALSRNQLELFYQPQVDGLTGKVVGVEALLRWNHPERGLLGPYDFIDIAEETGLINPIGDWVLQTAIAQVSDWAEIYGDEFKCAVNISGVQLRQDEFLRTTRDMLASGEVRPGGLVLELTESSIMTTSQSRVDWLREIQALGVEIAIDDFGTGYSSLSYLKKLPINYLKIDRSFVVDLADNKDDRVIAKTIFLMAQALGMKVVVEGVETPEQLQIVNEMGKCLIQGYLYSPPVPAEELESTIAGIASTCSGLRRKQQLVGLA